MSTFEYLLMCFGATILIGLLLQYVCEWVDVLVSWYDGYKAKRNEPVVWDPYQKKYVKASLHEQANRTTDRMIANLRKAAEEARERATSNHKPKPLSPAAESPQKSRRDLANERADRMVQHALANLRKAAAEARKREN